jgi:hypothetical protein
MRTAVVMIAVTLAAMSAAAAADQTIDAKVSGKIEGAGAKVSGTITINVAPAPEKKADEDEDKVEQLEKCGKEWNKQLEAYNKARADGRKPSWLWLTRLDYRSCMAKCLGIDALNPPKCAADLEDSAQQKH